ncbi:MAG: DUF1573 domain-containing protein [Prevotellaceae bacterium]|nr:DUF1573 domain-containing protein [Prevotellaceae bacterium]
MNRVIKTLASFAVMLFVFNASAQQLEFDELVHDFGTLKEEMGSATHTFIFTNTGDKPLVITHVSASCGCTTPGWTKEPVQPGGKGEVLATYRTSPGPFDKTLTVIASGLPNTILHIKGNVERKPEDFSVTYPQTFGDLKAKVKNDFSFLQITSMQVSTSQVIDVANDSNAEVSVSFENVPEYIIAVAAPEKLAPKQKGQIVITVDGRKRKSFGYSKDKITVHAGKGKEEINIASIVSEKIEQAEKYPACDVLSPTVDFGTLTKTKATGSIEIRNVGNADLLIKSFTTDNSAFEVDLKSEVKIKAGETGTIAVSAKNLQKGRNAALMFFATNDPQKSLLRITAKAEVE